MSLEKFVINLVSEDAGKSSPAPETTTATFALAVGASFLNPNAFRVQEQGKD